MLLNVMNFAKRHPVGLYLGLTFTLTWVGMLLWIRGSSENIPWFTFGPLVGALLTSGLVGGAAGIKALLARQVHWRVNIGWYAVAICLPIALELTTVVLNVALGAQVPAWGRMRPWTSILIMTATYLVFSGPLGEELGWRGFALPRLLERFRNSPRGAVFASLILGVIHAAWHLPLFLVGEIDLPGLLSPLTAVIVFTWLMQHTQGNVLLAVLFHAAVQNSGRFLGPIFLGPDATQQQWLRLAVWAVASLVIVVVVGPARLVRTRAQHAEVPPSLLPERVRKDTAPQPEHT